MARLLPLLVLLLALTASSGRAQEGRADPADVEALRAQLEAASGLVEEARVRASDALDAAADALAARDAALADQARWRTDADVARDQLQQLEAGDEDPEELAADEVPVSPDDGAELPELRDALTRLRADLAVARERELELTAEAERLARRASELPEELARARQLQAEAEQRLEVAADGLALDARAVRLRERAQAAAASARHAALEAEASFVEARQGLLPALRTHARARIAAYEDAVAALTERVDAARREQDARDAAEKERLFRAATQRFPELGKLASTNQELEARFGEIRLRQRVLEGGATPEEEDAGPVRGSLGALERDELELAERYGATLEKVRRAGLAGALGVVLQRELARLPAPPSLRRRAEELRRTLAEDQLLLIEMEEERDRLAALNGSAASLVAELASAGAEVDGELERIAGELLAARRDTVLKLATELQAVVELETNYVETLERMADLADEFREFIAERILWVRAPPRERAVGVDDVEATLAWVLDPAAWRRAWAGAFAQLVERPLVPVLLGLVIAGIAARVRTLRRKLTELGERVRSFRTDSFGLTLEALLFTVVLAAPVPLALLLVAWLLGSPPGQPDVADAAAAALRRAALLVAAGTVLLVGARPKGLCEAHLRWPGASARHLRLHLRWFLPTGAVLMAAVRLLEAGAAAGFAGALGRLVLAAGLLVLAGFLAVLLRPSGSLFADVYKRSPGSLLERTSWLWYSAATVLPFAVAVMAVLGYGYGALQLAHLLGNSLVLLILVVLGYGLLLRWLYVVRRRLLVEQARQRARARQEEEEGEATTPAAAIDEDELDVATIDQQTRRLFRTGALGAVAVGLYLTWSSALPALHVLERVQLYPDLRVVEETDSLAATPLLLEYKPSLEREGDGAGVASRAEDASPSAPALTTPAEAVDQVVTTLAPIGTVVTLGNLLGAMVAVLVMIVAAQNLPGLLEITLLKRLPVEAGSRYAISALVRYGIIGVGTTLALGAIGVGWSNVQWLAAALTFGLGFGLQEIFANFVSGLIILLERPVRVGDVVTVAGVEGRVTQIHMRSTTITDWDNRELLVPNREFITASLINWTLSDSVTRVVIAVGIAYGSDTRKARGLLMRCARECEFVLREPAPSAIFREFADSSLLFNLRVFIGNRDLWPQAVDDLHQRIDDAFRKAEIEIAFPQRDLHVRSIGPLADALGPRAPTPSS